MVWNLLLFFKKETKTTKEIHLIFLLLRLPGAAPGAPSADDYIEEDDNFGPVTPETESQQEGWDT